MIGAGSWGTTMASLVTGNAASVMLWARRPELAETIDTRHANPDYLPGRSLSPALRATADLELALSGAEVVVLAVPSHGLREVLEHARGAQVEAVLAGERSPSEGLALLMGREAKPEFQGIRLIP